MEEEEEEDCEIEEDNNDDRMTYIALLLEERAILGPRGPLVSRSLLDWVGVKNAQSSIIRISFRYCW